MGEGEEDAGESLKFEAPRKMEVEEAPGQTTEVEDDSAFFIMLNGKRRRRRTGPPEPATPPRRRTEVEEVGQSSALACFATFFSVEQSCLSLL